MGKLLTFLIATVRPIYQNFDIYIKSYRRLKRFPSMLNLLIHSLKSLLSFIHASSNPRVSLMGMCPIQVLKAAHGELAESCWRLSARSRRPQASSPSSPACSTPSVRSEVGSPWRWATESGALGSQRGRCALPASPPCRGLAGACPLSEAQRPNAGPRSHRNTLWGANTTRKCWTCLRRRTIAEYAAVALTSYR